MKVHWLEKINLGRGRVKPQSMDRNTKISL
jgi:hypothetical protein